VLSKQYLLTINHFNRQWRKKPYSFSQADLYALHAVYWDKYRCNLVLLQLEQDETRDLITLCRKNGVTVVSAVTAAFIAAHNEIIGPFMKNKAGVAIPFDLRTRLGEDIGNVFCLFVGGFQFSFAYNEKIPFWENAQEIHRIIEKHVKNMDISGPVRDMARFDPTLLDAANFAFWSQYIPEVYSRTKNLSEFAKNRKNAAFKFAKKMVDGFTGTVTTNLGRLDYPETYGNLQLDRMFFIPSGGGEIVPLLLGGVDVSGRLTFTVSYVERADGTGSYTTENMIRIRNRALEYLGFPEKATRWAMK
jgi:NRPS condensation-like uncharacterized protein